MCSLISLITCFQHSPSCFCITQVWPSGSPHVQLSISRMAFLSQCSKELQKAQFGWLGGQVKGHSILQMDKIRIDRNGTFDYIT